MSRLPLFIRKFIVDAIETGLAALFALSFILPSTVVEVERMIVVIGMALLGAVISALRRVLPDFYAWVREKLGVPIL
jgi:hypothetical protein